MKYRCSDETGNNIIDASSKREAAEKFVSGGDYEPGDETYWVSVEVEGEIVKIPIYPQEPECQDEEWHDWQSPHDILGGLEENPGVWGHGGGVTITEVCAHCGAYRITDTWAQDPVDGEQGLRSVEYRVADDVSLEWANNQSS